MTDERELLDRLRALAEADEGRQAPPEAEARLRAAFRRRHQASLQVRPRRAWPRWTFPGLAAAAVLVALLAGLAAREPRGSRSDAASAAASGAEDATPEFVAVVAGDRLTDLEALQVLRVQVPRTAVATLGWPVALPEEGRTLTADVLVGEDGVARAVRFVP